MYRLSKYVKDPMTTDESFWYHPITRQRVGMSDELRSMLPRIIVQDGSTQAESPEEIFLQLMAIELSGQGFLIADNIDSEDQFLQTLVPLEQSRLNIFGLPYRSLYELSDQTKAAIFVNTHGRSETNLSNYLSWVLNLEGEPFSLGTMVPLKKDNICNIGQLSSSNLSDELRQKQIRNVTANLPNKTVPIMIGGSHNLTLAALKGLGEVNSDPFDYVHIDSDLDIDCPHIFGDLTIKDLPDVKQNNFVSHIHAQFPCSTIYHVGTLPVQYSDHPVDSQMCGDYLKRIGSVISGSEFIQKSMEEICNYLPNKKRIYLSLDINGILKMLASGLSLNVRELLKTVQYLVENNTIIGVDMMELDHRMDQSLFRSLILTIIEVLGK